MKFKNGQEFLTQKNKVISLIGLSGVGKTTIARKLPADNWFHYSADYRIWTHYLSDELNDYLKTLAMSHPILRDMLMKDAISVEHRVHFDNLLATSLYMGMLGNPKLHGSTEADFRARMQNYSIGEIRAMLDIPKFIERARNMYNYDNFLVDASGSVCEIVDPSDATDPVIETLAKTSIIIYIEATQQHREELLKRAASDPKPIYYRPDFLDVQIPKLLQKFDVKNVDQIDPVTVGQYMYPELLAHRIPRYEQITENFGYKIPMTELSRVNNEREFLSLIARTIDDM